MPQILVLSCEGPCSIMETPFESIEEGQKSTTGLKRYEIKERASAFLKNQIRDSTSALIKAIRI